MVYLGQTLIGIAKQAAAIPAGAIGQAVEDETCPQGRGDIGKSPVVFAYDRSGILVVEKMKGAEFRQIEPGLYISQVSVPPSVRYMPSDWCGSFGVASDLRVSFAWPFRAVIKDRFCRLLVTNDLSLADDLDNLRYHFGDPAPAIPQSTPSL